MSRYAPQWLQAASYSGSQDRRLISALWPAPASSGAGATVVGSSMSVVVAPGQVAVPSPNQTGSTLCTWDAPETVTHTTIGSGGGNRIDLITCHPRGNDLDGGANNDFIIDVVPGAVAATPAVPVTPAGQVALWQVFITGGAVALVSGNLTDVRPSGLAIGGAGALPPPVTSGGAVVAYTDQNGEVWVAKNGVGGGAWRKARDVLRARIYRNSPWTSSAGNQVLNMDTVQWDLYGMFAANGIKAPVAGDYAVTVAVSRTGAASDRVQAGFYQNGSIVSLGAAVHGVGAFLFGSISSDIARCAAGDQLLAQVFSAQASTGTTGAINSFMTVSYAGTG